MGGACTTGADAGKSKNVRCRQVWNSWYGWVSRCRSSLLYFLAPEDIPAIETKIEDLISDQLRYDMKASVIELADGGYNIVLHNRRERTAYSGDADHRFRSKPITDSARSRSPIPLEADH